jgi:hypothetical protein
MSDQHPMPLADEFEYRIEFRVVDHDQAALRVAKLHADVFPHFDGDGAGRECGIELLDDLLLPLRPVPALHRERRRVGHRRGMIRDKLPRDPRLLGQRREVGIIDVDGQQPEVVGFGRIEQRRVR